MSFRASPIRDLQRYSNSNYNKINYSPIVPNITPFMDQNEKLNELIHHKNLQITKLYEENNLVRKMYEEEIQTYKKTIDALQIELMEKERVRDVGLMKIKEKFEELNEKESENLKSLHTHEVQFLLKEIAQQRNSNDTLNLKISLKDQEIQNIRQSYQRQLSANTNEINHLNKIIHKLEEQKNKQIRELNSKRQLEKSRTSGLIASRRENSHFMDKQVRKLNEEMLEKQIQIQSLSRQLTRELKKSQDMSRIHSNLVNQLKENHQLQIEEKNQQILRNEKNYKIQITELKELQLKYINEIQTLKSTNNMQQKSIDSLKDVLNNRQDEIHSLKQVIQKNRVNHVNEINSLMKQRRKSRSQIGSSRSIISLKDSSMIQDSPPQTPYQNNESISLMKYQSNFEGSARLEKNLRPIKQETPDRHQQKDYSRELAESHVDEDNIETDLERAVYHYDNLIEELKRNHSSEIQLLKLSEKKIRIRLEEKEHQILDILTKFSPLVKIHAGEKTVEEDRKQRLQRHWKSDVALLEVLLRKYKIRVFQ